MGAGGLADPLEVGMSLSRAWSLQEDTTSLPPGQSGTCGRPPSLRRAGMVNRRERREDTGHLTWNYGAPGSSDRDGLLHSRSLARPPLSSPCRGPPGACSPGLAVKGEMKTQLKKRRFASHVKQWAGGSPRSMLTLEFLKNCRWSVMAAT